MFHLVTIDALNATTSIASRHYVRIGPTVPEVGKLDGNIVDDLGAPLGGVLVEINRGIFTTHSNAGGAYSFHLRRDLGG